jgi:hypothetical protein
MPERRIEPRIAGVAPLQFDTLKRAGKPERPRTRRPDGTIARPRRSVRNAVPVETRNGIPVRFYAYNGTGRSMSPQEAEDWLTCDAWLTEARDTERTVNA